MRHVGILSPFALCALAAAHAAPPAAPAQPAASAPGILVANDCPAQLQVSQTVTAAVPGWTAQNQQASYPFARVAFYPGPPGETRLIVPKAEYKRPAGLHDGWDLPPRPGGYWMTCAYGNTTATVARKLPDKVDYCQADYDSRFITLIVKHWACGMRPTPRPTAKPKPAARHPGG